MERLWKVLGHKRVPYHGGVGVWAPPGEWMPEIVHVVPCESGYHLLRDRDLVMWLGPCIHTAEAAEPIIIHKNSKIVAGKARLLSGPLQTWDERVARLFACDCADRVARIVLRICLL